MRISQKTFRKIILSCIALLIFVAALLSFIVSLGNGKNPSGPYPVRGIDVSEHQGEIDWQAVRGAGFDFAFVKATEGRDYQDAYFGENWRGCATAGVARSAYHFFTFKSTGLDQARNFISYVPYEPGSLPPAIDLEFSGNSEQIPDKDTLREELRDFIDELEKTYRKAPILYVTYESYKKYIEGDFNDCLIWIRDLSQSPVLDDGRDWAFWQYSDQGRVEGIKGFVDLDVFKGDEKALFELLAQAYRFE